MVHVCVEAYILIKWPGGNKPLLTSIGEREEKNIILNHSQANKAWKYLVITSIVWSIIKELVTWMYKYTNTHTHIHICITHSAYVCWFLSKSQWRVHSSASASCDGHSVLPTRSFCTRRVNNSYLAATCCAHIRSWKSLCVTVIGRVSYRMVIRQVCVTIAVWVSQKSPGGGGGGCYTSWIHLVAEHAWCRCIHAM